ncbi:arsr-type transcription regulator hth motif [Trichococcus pasteurii]|uniref:Arsr-type transcription regulator hth motif n=2 Tax=Trichococcus pasteurii TaxID=43064 RepID=A0A1W1IJG2_9LACT|nr:DNA-binding transcriptional regulator, ArsR family [Trichococcus pasteurii]SLM53156.1 arsr-type transcription regulator hth motif [Trichococcus pasteurii]SSB94037.1 arsr-type transcription regulator hth motif [Trichococcus pasteurii]
MNKIDKMDIDVCSVTVVHEEKVNYIIAELQGKDFASLSVLSKCLGETSRVQILYALATYKEMCVCDLAAIIDASMATTSHHLRFLKKNGVTTSYREGKMVYYSLANEEIVTFIRSVLRVGEDLQLIS